MPMIHRAIKKYYVFFDETIQSSTFIVLVISLLICAVGIIAPSVSAELSLNAAPENIIVIDGVEYHFQLIKK